MPMGNFPYRKATYILKVISSHYKGKHKYCANVMQEEQVNVLSSINQEQYWLSYYFI